MGIRDIVGRYVDVMDRPASGSVRIEPNATLVYPDGQEIIAAKSVVIPLDSTGTVLFSDCLTTDTLGVTPAGWAYRITEYINGANARSYSIFVPAGGTPLDLYSVTPTDPAPPNTEYVLAATLTTKGDLLGRTSSALARIPVGASGTFLKADPAASTGVSWDNPAAGTDPAPLIAEHNADSTAVHGIADTSALETSAGATAKVSAHVAATDPHGDRAYADSVGATKANVSHAHSATDVTSGTLDSARLSIGTAAGSVAAGDDSRFNDAVFPLSGYGLVAASDNPIMWGASSTLSANTIFYARIWVPAGVPINGLYTPVRVAGTHDGTSSPNQLGLYDDNGVKLDETPDDPTLWAAVGWRGGNIGAQKPAQSAGRFVYGVFLMRGFTNVTIPFPHNPNDANGPWFSIGAGTTKRRGGYANGQTSLPASFDPTTFGTASSYFPLIGFK